MPLLDHFHPPLSQERHWDSFHAAWAEAMAVHLNHDLLPDRYYAEARVTVGNRVEIDVGAFEEGKSPSSGANGGVAVWAPSKPLATVPVNFDQIDEFEVQILNDEAGPQVVAAIELVSPANKDRPTHRRLFAAKCAGYLQAGISVAVVDVVTGRTANLQPEIFEILGAEAATPGQSKGELYASVYRTVSDKSQTTKLQIWAEILEIGKELPTMPLWISLEQSVPLDLEMTYRTACANRRISV